MNRLSVIPAKVTHSVIPAKAGTQTAARRASAAGNRKHWIPAFAGMTARSAR